MPRRLFERSWAFDESCPSPTIAYSIRSGPNRIRPPLWYGSALAGTESSTFIAVPAPFPSWIRTIWLRRPSAVERVTYTYTNFFWGHRGWSATPSAPRSPLPFTPGIVISNRS